jgi:hypothetical protein
LAATITDLREVLVAWHASPCASGVGFSGRNYQPESTMNTIHQETGKLCKCGCGTIVSRNKYSFTRGHYSRVTGNRDAAKKTSEKLCEGYASGRIKHRGKLPIETLASIGEKNSARHKGKILRKTEVQEWEKEKLREMIAGNPLTAKGIENRMAKWWYLRNPENKTYRFKNLLEFVRSNHELFAKEDVQWRQKGLGLVCNATNGIASISPRKKNPKGSWKGWTWVSITEQCFNDNADLLDRVATL